MDSFRLNATAQDEDTAVSKLQGMLARCPNLGEPAATATAVVWVRSEPVHVATAFFRAAA